MRRTALALAAALAGCSGLALETLLLDSAGLGLGYGSATALGLATFLAAWAFGAYRAGKSALRPRASLFGAGALAALSAWPAVWLVLASGRAPGGALAVAGTLLAIATVAFLQGAFLPTLARADGGGVAVLFAANLAGAVGGVLWIADRIVADSGRLAAAGVAAGIALAAGAFGGLAAGRSALPPARIAAATGDLAWRDAAWIVALATAWVVALEWIGLRLGVLWLGGMQPALRSVLVASMISLAVGAALLPPIVPRGSAGVLWVLVACSLGAVWPLFAARALAGTSRGELATALVLVMPSLVPFGGLLPVLHRALPLESGARLGRLLLHEAWGAFAGVPLVHFVLVPRCGLVGSIAILEACGVGALLALSRALPAAARVAAGLPLLLGAWAWFQAPPALESPPLSNPALRVRSFAEDRDFAVTVVDDGMQGERTLLTDGFRAAGTGREYRYMQVLGHLPVLLSARPRRVAVLALGTGTTLGAVAQHPEVERIDVLEISRAVVDAAPWFVEKNRGALAGDASSGRVVVRLGDGRATLGGARSAYDVITMEPLLPDSPFGVYLYTREFYACARAALAPEGLVCQWVPPHALEPASFAAVLEAFASAFPWSSIWLSGTQVILLGGDREPALAASRFQATGDLARSLAELGLATPAELLSRFVADGKRIASAARPLRDADPWIVYRPRRAGAVLLADLPRNLGFLRALGGPTPSGWLAAAGPDAARAVEGMRALRGAREAHAESEARLRGWREGPGEAPLLTPTFASALATARAGVGDDPELADLETEIAFLADLRSGVSTLASDASPQAARAALPALLASARQRPERADVHLYAATALERIGDPGAERELTLALAACPRIAQTPEGRRCRTLGLSDAAWSRAEATAARAERDFFTNNPSGRTSGVVTSDSP
ncbi:MAG TPA: hypothetical protein VGR31_01485 [Planctomycetota bacterium]|nr:hypothetical protein [Planctomycetota bacterium]